MRIISPDFLNNENIPIKFTCDGANISPLLQVSDVPQTSESLVLIMDDPDSPTGTWAHWLVWNIQPQTKEILENSVPTGAQEGTTSFHSTGYGGPCPHSGNHHYRFKIYALNTLLELDSSADQKQVEAAMAGHIVDQAELVGLYQRK